MPKVLFLDSCKGNEADAAPVSTPDLIVPYQDTARLAIRLIFEADNARLNRAICLNAKTNDAAINNPGMIICPHEIVKRDDLNGIALTA
jgi:hypothetical protein